MKWAQTATTQYSVMQAIGEAGAMVWYAINSMHGVCPAKEFRFCFISV